MSKPLYPSQPKYRIYPTLLDAYQWYLTSQQDTAFQDLIDKINRVPIVSEAADKGTAFNEVIDLYLQGGIELHPSGLFLHNGFAFEAPLVEAFAANLHGATSQVRLSAPLSTCYGEVEMYGVMDELLQGVAVDVKTTKQYTFPKYLQAWQHVVYPFILKHHTGIDYNFCYLITDFKDIYAEDYQYDHERDSVKLRGFVEQFIEFLESHRALITDPKIFGLDQPHVLIAEQGQGCLLIHS